MVNDIIIIGGGPAGISAALYAARAGLSVRVIDGGGSALLKAHKIDNYYGGETTGEELYARGHAQARALGVVVMCGEATGVSYDDGFSVAVGEETYASRALILATGAGRRTPSIEGLADFEGRGVSYCAVCDGFFFRNKTVAVLGSGEYARHEADYLAPLAKKVCVFTNGEQPSADFSQYEVIAERIARLEGDSVLRRAVFDNRAAEIDGLFVAIGVAGSAAFARKLGARLDGSAIYADDSGRTSIKGLYAAGDCTGGLLQISKAVADGAVAATECIKYVRSLNG